MAKGKRTPKPKAAPFGKITQAMWSDAKFRALTPLLPSGQALWIYLLVGRERTQIPGVTACGRGSLTDSLRWSPSAFAAAWSEIAVQEMAEADWTAPMIWIPNAIKHNFPESPSVVIGWRIRWDEIPDCPLKHKAWRELRSAMQAKGEAWLQAFEQACREPVGQPVTQPVVEPVAQAVPHQEQEQEQEQEGLEAASAGSTPTGEGARTEPAAPAPASAGPVKPPPSSFPASLAKTGAPPARWPLLGRFLDAYRDRFRQLRVVEAKTLPPRDDARLARLHAALEALTPEAAGASAAEEVDARMASRTLDRPPGSFAYLIEWLEEQAAAAAHAPEPLAARRERQVSPGCFVED